jgi:hypothetical protein
VTGLADNREHNRATAVARPSAWWAFVLAFALVEVTAHAVARFRVPSIKEWQEAAAFVRENKKEGDAITVAPAWADPILRWVLGDRISLADAGRSDLAGYNRLWALAIRGARPAEAPGREADFSKQFGKVKVLRWDLPPSDLVVDLVKEVKNAQVSIVHHGSEQSCPYMTFGPSPGGGLGQGVVVPRQRFVCDSDRSGLWVAPVVLEDLSLAPRYCVWQQPEGREPVRVTYRDVPLGERIQFYGGLYYEHERNLEGGPVDAVIRVNGRKIAEMVHHDGDGWKALTASIPKSAGQKTTGEISIEVTAERPHKRSFCWAATVRGNAQGGTR